MRKGLLAATLLILNVGLATAQENEEFGNGPNVTPVPLGGGSAAPGSLVIGTGAFAGAVAHDAFAVDPGTDTSDAIFSAVPVWGAAYDAANNAVIFTSSGGTTDGADLYSWPTGGGVPALVGNITFNGMQIRIDGLAFAGGVLYGVHQFDDAVGTAGLYSIDQGTLTATFIGAITSGAISGLGADQSTGILYGVNDTAGELQIISTADASLTTVTAYPATETDIDGLAVGNGLAYLVHDDNAPAEIFVYDLNAGTYLTSLTSPFTGTDTFSAGAFVGTPPPPAIIPTMSQVGLVALALTLMAVGFLVMRRRVQ